MRIGELDPIHLPLICRADGGNGWTSDPSTWQAILDRHREGTRLVLVALEEKSLLGYGSLLWHSRYPPFEAAAIPEVHDLAVSQFHRGRGVGSALIGALEDRAKMAGRLQTGIEVGLYADYGPAQRLYSALGYHPDGRGVTRDYRFVPPGTQVPLDDDLLLWMVKRL